MTVCGFRGTKLRCVVSEVQSDGVWFQRYKVTVCGFRGTK